MSTTTDPCDIATAAPVGVGRLVGGGLDAEQREEQIDQLTALYAEHTDVRHPFAPLADDVPLTTRAQLRDHFAGSQRRTRGVERFEPVDLQAHRTDDPEVVIVEFSYEGSVAGRSFALPCIFVMRVRDGEIVESRDYADGVGFARAFGHLDQLAERLTAPAEVNDAG